MDSIFQQSKGEKDTHYQGLPRKEGVKDSNGMAGPAPEEPAAAATQAH